MEEVIRIAKREAWLELKIHVMDRLRKIEIDPDFKAENIVEYARAQKELICIEDFLDARLNG